MPFTSSSETGMALEVRKVVTLGRAEKSLEGAKGGPWGGGVSHILFLHLGDFDMGMFTVKI